ncbi:MAG: trehalose-phosphatase, partial [Bacteroidota bacterium]
VYPILEMYTDRLPGAFIEERDFSLSWHYEKSDIEQSSFLSKEVNDHLLSITANIGLQVLHGKGVIEVSNSGINKGELAMHWLSRKNYDFVMAIGAGWSDEMLFQVLPKQAFSIKVGVLKTKANYVIKKQTHVIDLLDQLENVPGSILTE